MQKLENLRKLRTHIGATPKSMAKALGIDEEEYLGYEQGTRELSLDMLCNIANTFHISTDTILDRVVLPKILTDDFLSD